MSSAAPEAKRPATAKTGPVVLEARDVEMTYNTDTRAIRVLRGVSVEVRQGEILAITGPSGAGKSTLLHILGLLDECDHGAVLIDGKDASTLTDGERSRLRNERLGFVFQFYHLFRDLTALENVYVPRMVREGGARPFVWSILLSCAVAVGAWFAFQGDLETPAFWGAIACGLLAAIGGPFTVRWFIDRSRRAVMAERAHALLERVHLTHRLTHCPSELSGGERQRVAIARALMNEPAIVLCDEPTGNLDERTAAEVLEVIWRLNEETGQTFVIVTHDEALARRAHRSIRVVDGRLVGETHEPAQDERETGFRLRGRPSGGTWARSALVSAALGMLTPIALAGWVCARIFDDAPGRWVDPSGAFMPPSIAWIAAAGALTPIALIAWTWFMFSRFRRATRRGFWGIDAVLLFLIVPPPFGFFGWPFVHLHPLGIAEDILQANDRPRLGWQRIAAAVLWPIASLSWIGVVAAWRFFKLIDYGEHVSRFGDTVHDSISSGIPTLAASALLAGLATAWIQHLHNRFYRAMESPVAPEPPAG